MTQVLTHRLNRQTPPPAGESRSRSRDRTGHPDAADLASRVRELSLRAHRAVRHRRNAADAGARMDLRELRTAISGLETDVRNLRLHSLERYVQALGHEVENRLR